MEASCVSCQEIIRFTQSMSAGHRAFKPIMKRRALSIKLSKKYQKVTAVYVDLK